MAKWLVVLISFALLGLGPASAQTTTESRYGVTKVLVIGDSIAEWGSPELAKLRPGWTIDAKFGRNVGELHTVLGSHLRSNGSPKVLIVALGTNARDSWTKADYGRARAMVDPRTFVGYVTPYRRDDSWAGSRQQMQDYARWMRQIAKANERTFIINWRGRASRFPELLNSDGVHPTKLGTIVWANMVSERTYRAT